MTLIQPKIQRTTLPYILGALALVLLGSVVALVVSYNATVGVRHDIAQAKEEVQTLQAEISQLKESLFAAFNSARLEAFAKEHALVKDDHPRYLEIVAPEQWAFVSH